MQFSYTIVTKQYFTNKYIIAQNYKFSIIYIKIFIKYQLYIFTIYPLQKNIFKVNQ